MLCFVGVVRKGSGSAVTIAFPDLPGCSTAGRTIGEARRIAAEVLARHLAAMSAAGQAVPVPRDLGAIRDDPTCRDATTLILVEAPEQGAKTAKPVGFPIIL